MSVVAVAALVVALASVVFVPLDVASSGGDGVRAVGRVVLVVAGWLVRPPVRRLRESPVERCRRVGHRPVSWSGYDDTCGRCRRWFEPSLSLDDVNVRRVLKRDAARLVRDLERALRTAPGTHRSVPRRRHHRLD